MTDTSARNRQPAGISTGGQFATEPRSETGVSLTAPAPRHLGLRPDGLIDVTQPEVQEDPAALEYAQAVQTLQVNRRRARAAVGGSSQHQELIVAEAVLVRGLAMRLDPSLVEEAPHILGPKTNEAASKLLRSGIAEILAEHPVPAQPTLEQRARAARLFAAQSTQEPLGSAAYTACHEVMAEFGVGDCTPVTAVYLAREVDAARASAVLERRPFGVEDMVGVLNRQRAELGFPPLP